MQMIQLVLISQTLKKILIGCAHQVVHLHGQWDLAVGRGAKPRLHRDRDPTMRGCATSRELQVKLDLGV
jgi:hypothetical protein